MARLIALLARCALASSPGPGPPLPAACQAAVDALCASDCFPHIKARPCDGPLLGRLDAGKAGAKMAGWKCYSPSTLDPATRTAYVTGTCYCSRDAQIAAVLVATPGCPAPAPPPPPPPVFNGSTPVFYPGLNGSQCFRIPTITKTAAGTLLAFAENRKGGCGDDGTHDLVLRRSADDGATWGPLLTVRRGAVPCPGCPAAVSNPNPIEVTLADGTSRAVLLHYDTMNNPSASRHGLDEQLWSFDDGRTWGNASVLAYPPLANVGTMIGPSTGIQAASGAIYFVAHGGASGNFLYWSRDFGGTWTPSAVFTETGNECSIAFLVSPADGRIIMNCRTSLHKRLQLLWGADGVRIGNATYPAGLVDAGCQGSIANVDGVLLTSNAASAKGRQQMTVKRSADQGGTWSHGTVVWAGPSGYSQLVDLHGARPGAVGLLFEAGRKAYTETISYVNVAV